MKLKDFLKHFNENESFTFVIAKAVKDEHAPGHHFEYRTTPIRSIWEWLRGEDMEKYIVINPSHPPIDVTGNWVNSYERCWLHCCIITTEFDLNTLYSGEQYERMLKHYDEKVNQYLDGSK